LSSIFSFKTTRDYDAQVATFVTTITKCTLTFFIFLTLEAFTGDKLKLLGDSLGSAGLEKKKEEKEKEKKSRAKAASKSIDGSTEAAERRKTTILTTWM
jgi:hypothetical protein